MRIRFRDDDELYGKDNKNIFFWKWSVRLLGFTGNKNIIRHFISDNPKSLAYLKSFVYSQEEYLVEKAFNNIHNIEDFFKYFIVEELFYKEIKISEITGGKNGMVF